MFLGHFAVGFAAKRAAPRASLATLFVAAQLVDLAWPVLVLLGIETVRVDPGNTAFTPLDFVAYPWTHSLAAGLVWALAFALAYRARTGYARGAFAVGILVLSHWVLDLVSHRPDLPLAPGLPVKVGLGLWRSVPATVAVELGLFAAGVAVYLSCTRARSWKGSLPLWLLAALLLLLYGANLSQVPPSAAAVAGGGLAMWIFVPWMWWLDRHREPRGAVPPGAPPGA